MDKIIGYTTVLLIGYTGYKLGEANQIIKISTAIMEVVSDVMSANREEA